MEEAVCVLLSRFPSVFPDQSRSVAVCHHDGILLLSSTRCCQLLPGRPGRPAEHFTYISPAVLVLCSVPQLDFSLWIPNCPPAMMRPPPQVKGAVTEDDIMSFLPDVNSACRVLTVITLLSRPALNFVRLHPSTHRTRKETCLMLHFAFGVHPFCLGCFGVCIKV